MDTIILRKTVNFGKLLGIIDKVLHALTILRSKVLRHAFKTLVHAFTDGNAGHYDDELRPPIEAVQFKHRLDIGIGLTCTRFHFNRKRQAFSLQLFYRFQALRHLNGADIVAKAVAAQGYRSVSEPLHFIHTPVCPLVHQEVAQTIALRLP